MIRRNVQFNLSENNSFYIEINSYLIDDIFTNFVESFQSKLFRLVLTSPLKARFHLFVFVILAADLVFTSRFVRVKIIFASSIESDCSIEFHCITQLRIRIRCIRNVSFWAITSMADSRVCSYVGYMLAQSQHPRIDFEYNKLCCWLLCTHVIEWIEYYFWCFHTRECIMFIVHMPSIRADATVAAAPCKHC